MRQRAGVELGRILGKIVRRSIRVVSQRQIPAKRRCAVPIRVYESGRSPLHLGDDLGEVDLPDARERGEELSLGVLEQ